jgi:hypothetical protein
VGKLVVAVLYLALSCRGLTAWLTLGSAFSRRAQSLPLSLVGILHCRASAAASLAEGRDAELHVAGCRRECTLGL